MRACTAVLIFATVLIGSVIGQTGQEQDCPANQEWNNCGASCEPQCNNFRGAKCPDIQTLQCVPQCACKPGYFRISENECSAVDSAECGGQYQSSLQ